MNAAAFANKATPAISSRPDPSLHRPTDYLEPPIDGTPLINESFPDSNRELRSNTTTTHSLRSLYEEVKDVVGESFALVGKADPAVLPARIVLAIGQAMQYGAYGWLTAKVIPAVRGSDLYAPSIIAPIIAAFALKSGLELLQRKLESTQMLHQLKIESHIQARLRAVAPKSLEMMNRPDIAQDYRVVHGGGIWAFVSANSTLIQGIGTAGSMLMAIGISYLYAPTIVTLALLGNAAFQAFKTVQLTTLSLHHEELLSVKRSTASQLGWQRIWPSFSQLFRGLGITSLIDSKVAERREVIISAEKQMAQKKFFYDRASTVLSGATAAGGFFAILGAMKSSTNPLSPENAVYVGLSMIPIFLSSLDQIGKSVVDMIKAKPTLAALSRLEKSRQDEEQGQAKTIDWSKSKGAPIVVENLHFAYPTSDQTLRPVPIISNLNLKIEPGEFVAVVGDNGAGKSTLVNLLTRSCRPLVGSVAIHGISISDTTDESLFTGVKSLPQNSLQIDGYTIRDFLSWGRAAAGMDQDDKLLKRILKATGVDEFLNKTIAVEKHGLVQEFPEGIDTKLGAQDGGKNLSGGQLSLLYIAYMLYSNAQVLCFDEPEKAVAKKRQEQFFKTLSSLEDLLGYRPTIIVVTHERDSLPQADRVLFMRKGGLPAFGTHDELKNKYRDYQEFIETAPDKNQESLDD